MPVVANRREVPKTMTVPDYLYILNLLWSFLAGMVLSIMAR